MARRWYALEGIVHAGKTSLLRALESSDANIGIVQEYTEHTLTEFPPPPTSTRQVTDAMRFFLALERARIAALQPSDVVVLDRSILSVLAYQFAIAKACSKPEYYSAALIEFERQPWTWPDVCVYLQITDQLLSNRHASDSSSYHPMLVDPVFNQHLRAFYETELPSRWAAVELLSLDGTVSTQLLCEQMLLHIRAFREEALRVQNP
jgi:thymidylate kinase